MVIRFEAISSAGELAKLNNNFLSHFPEALQMTRKENDGAILRTH